MIASQEKITNLLDNYYIEKNKKLFEKFFIKLNKENINYNIYLLKKNSLKSSFVVQIQIYPETIIL